MRALETNESFRNQRGEVFLKAYRTHFGIGKTHSINIKLGVELFEHTRCLVIREQPNAQSC